MKLKTIWILTNLEKHLTVDSSSINEWILIIGHWLVFLFLKVVFDLNLAKFIKTWQGEEGREWKKAYNMYKLEGWSFQHGDAHCCWSFDRRFPRDPWGCYFRTSFEVEKNVSGTCSNHGFEEVCQSRGKGRRRRWWVFVFFFCERRMKVSEWWFTSCGFGD